MMMTLAFQDRYCIRRVCLRHLCLVADRMLAERERERERERSSMVNAVWQVQGHCREKLFLNMFWLGLQKSVI